MSKRLWIVAGPNGAGKTTLVSKFNKKELFVLNPDDIALQWPEIPEEQRHLKAGRQAVMKRKELFKQEQSFIIETTFSGKNSLRLVENAQKAGYRVSFVAVLIPSATVSLGRVGERVKKGGHNVPIEAIVRRYQRSMSNIEQAIGKVNRAFIVENSSVKGIMVARIEKGRYKRQYPNSEKIMKSYFPKLRIKKAKEHLLSF